jgi:hypothetical protein
MLVVAAPFCEPHMSSSGDELRASKRCVEALELAYAQHWSPQRLSGMPHPYKPTAPGVSVVVMKPRGRGGDAAQYGVSPFPFAVLLLNQAAFVTALNRVTTEGLLACLPLVQGALVGTLVGVQGQAVRKALAAQMLQQATARIAPIAALAFKKGRAAAAAEAATAAAAAAAGASSSSAPASGEAGAAEAEVEAEEAEEAEAAEADEEAEDEEVAAKPPRRRRASSGAAPNAVPTLREDLDLLLENEKCRNALGCAFFWPLVAAKPNLSVAGLWFPFGLAKGKPSVAEHIK